MLLSFEEHGWPPPHILDTMGRSLMDSFHCKL